MISRKLLIMMLSVAAALGGCMGGGSTGTDSGGLRRVEFDGTLQSVRGQDLAGVEIIVQETGARGVTDDKGSFGIVTEASESDLTLLFVGAGLDNTISINAIPAQDSLVKLALLADESANQLEVASLIITDREDSASSSSAWSSSAGSRNSGAPSVPHEKPSLFRGHIRWSGGRPVARARVRIKETMASDMTDAAGYFEMESPSRGGDLTIEVSVGRIKAQTVIHNIPKRSVVVNLELLVVEKTTQKPSQGPKPPPKPDLVLESVTYSSR